MQTYLSCTYCAASSAFSIISSSVKPAVVAYDLQRSKLDCLFLSKLDILIAPVLLYYSAKFMKRRRCMTDTKINIRYSSYPENKFGRKSFKLPISGNTVSIAGLYMGIKIQAMDCSEMEIILWQQDMNLTRNWHRC